MQVKDAITFLIIVVLVFFLFLSKCGNDVVIVPPDEEKIKQLEVEIAEREKEINVLKNERDQLLESNQQIKIITVEATEKIDSSIAKDSANAISEYRKALLLFEDIPNNTDLLTFREIGLGSKIITEAYGMKLRINNYEAALQKEKQISENYMLKGEAYRNIISEMSGRAEYYQAMYGKTQSFWYDRFVVVAGLGIGYSGNEFVPVFGITVGVKIWGSK
ncbi:MAG: hypothetical protein KGZ85_08040 [Ignavibacterium sp.]|nr:hypothetical protein [Ignavibacterium sp.]